jgi:hypothetical protein
MPGFSTNLRALCLAPCLLRPCHTQGSHVCGSGTSGRRCAYTRSTCARQTAGPCTLGSAACLAWGLGMSQSPEGTLLVLLLLLHGPAARVDALPVSVRAWDVWLCPRDLEAAGRPQ